MLHLIVGNTGSGKTTYSNKLKKKTKGVLFSIDTWNNTLFLPDKKETDGLQWFLERIERAEKLILNVVRQLEESGTDAILDLGLSKFKHREKFRAFAASNGFEIQLHFLDISKETRWQSVQQRNTEKGATF
ncbi:AAA family ATPase [Maribacter sp. R86514]|uniref:AAA family ATPase n=1 Tax=Maribacter sp. R86514 TaxID=3093854 RepID=UPI0037CB68DA